MGSKPCNKKIVDECAQPSPATIFITNIIFCTCFPCRRGLSCRYPWAVLHQDGAVGSLADAMDPRFDSQYARYASFDYHRCATAAGVAGVGGVLCV